MKWAGGHGPTFSFRLKLFWISFKCWKKWNQFSGWCSIQFSPSRSALLSDWGDEGAMQPLGRGSARAKTVSETSWTQLGVHLRKNQIWSIKSWNSQIVEFEKNWCFMNIKLQMNEPPRIQINPVYEQRTFCDSQNVHQIGWLYCVYKTHKAR